MSDKQTSSDERRRIVVLGSSGSIGQQVLDVAKQHADKIEVVGLAVNSNIDRLMQQAYDFGVYHLVVADNSLRGDVRCDEAAAFAKDHGGTFEIGRDTLCSLVCLDEVDIVINALMGAAGLRASYETLSAGKILALANKESLVVGGDLLMPLAHCLEDWVGKDHVLMPIDSEHGAIFQCLQGENIQDVARLWITASGGPFRGYSYDDLLSVTPQQALCHPTWNMGAKISVDSSTLMNKGLEVIEAHHLFCMPYDKIDVIVHPQSIVHSMVEFSDGSIKAHLSTTDMRIPIQFALSYPHRWDAPVTPLDFHTLEALDFESVDTKTFRCLDLARNAGVTGKTMPAVMNAANEVAVSAFLNEQLSFVDIASCVEEIMSRHVVCAVESIEQLEEVDAWARTEASAWIKKQSS